MDELIRKLVNDLNITEEQAKGGAGLLFKMAKEKLDDDDFSKLTAVLGNVGSLISASPKPQVGGLLSGLASAIGGDNMSDLATLSAGFKTLALDSKLILTFASTISDFIKTKGGVDAQALLQKLL